MIRKTLRELGILALSGLLSFCLFYVITKFSHARYNWIPAIAAGSGFLLIQIFLNRLFPIPRN